jgi:hypothetical protein
MGSKPTLPEALCAALVEDADPSKPQYKET